MNNKLTNDELLNNIKVSGFAYELIRNEFLSELLGKDYEELLYMGGKRLARKYPLNSLEELITFFEVAGFGDLELKKEKKSSATLTLSSPLIKERIKLKEKATYHLEAGFLAQSFEHLKFRISESKMDINEKKGSVTFYIEWDTKDQI